MKITLGIRYVLAVLVLFALSACGGSGGGGSSSSSGGGNGIPAGSSNWDQMKWDQDNWS